MTAKKSNTKNKVGKKERKDNRDNTPPGIPIEFLSREKLRNQDFDDKLNLIIEKMKENMILVLEEALTPEEKKELITKSVEEIDANFSGIEFSGLDSEDGFFDRIVNGLYKGILGKERRRGITIVGTSSVMEKIREERDSVSLLAKVEEVDKNAS